MEIDHTNQAGRINGCEKSGNIANDVDEIDLHMLPQTVEALIKKKKKIEAIEKFDLSMNYFFRLPFSFITAAKRCFTSLKRVSLTHRYHIAAKTTYCES